MASATRTATLWLGDLPQRLKEPKDVLADAGRDAATFQVCLLRGGLDWQDRKTRRNEFAGLGEIGVTPVLLRLPLEAPIADARQFLTDVATELID